MRNDLGVAHIGRAADLHVVRVTHSGGKKLITGSPRNETSRPVQRGDLLADLRLQRLARQKRDEQREERDARRTTGREESMRSASFQPIHLASPFAIVLGRADGKFWPLGEAISAAVANA